MAEGITTGIDALVEYIKTHGESDSATLASAMNVSETVIEEWAGILEKAGIVQITYKAAKMYVSPVEVSREHVEELQHSVEVKKSTLESDIMAQNRLLGDISSRLDALNKFIADADALFKSRSKTAHADLDEIDKLQSEISKHYNEIKSKKDYIDKASQTIGKESGALIERSNRIRDFDIGIEAANKSIEDAKSKVMLAESMIKELPKKFDAMVNENRKMLNEIMESAMHELNNVNEALDAQKKMLEESVKAVENYKRDAERIARDEERHREALVDSFAKAKSEASQLYLLSEKKFNDANKLLLEMKSSFGELASMHESIEKIKNEIAELSKEKELLAAELKKLSDENSAIRALGPYDAAKKRAQIETLSKRFTSISSRTAKLKKNIDKTDEEAKNIANKK
ncbi:MAG: hypothetical protein ACP5K9_00905 [Candidatus Micrarchaeia archaeon]